MTRKILSDMRSNGPEPFPPQDGYLLAEGKEFCVERCSAGEEFAEDGGGTSMILYQVPLITTDAPIHGVRST